ncbi:NAD(P)H-binding protein [Actinoplanes sp. NPDC049265]|uniref:NAD(P)H-binding protein n=1 Tax=Actinoplanes sp. NPDC049265 TaxID=3363902 RepID=UPI0037241797
MIIVTGASGQLGRAVVEDLLELVLADQVGVSVRDPERVADLRDRGVRVRQGDYASLGPSIEGATALLLVSAPLIGDAVTQAHRAAIDAAVAAGVKRVYYTSHMGAHPDSPFPPMRGHAATEHMLAASGLAHTVLRNGFYANTVARLLGPALQSGELRIPEDGAVAWTTHADLAAATARLLADDRPGRPAPAHTDPSTRTLTNDGRGRSSSPTGPTTHVVTDDGRDRSSSLTGPTAHILTGERPHGPTPALTGPAAVDMAEAAEIAARITGRPIRRVVVPADEFKQGLPEPTATMMAGMFEASRRGEFRPAGPELANLIGRPATSLEDYLKQVL